MAQKLTEAPVFAEDVNGPAYAESATSTSVNSPMQVLANRTRYLKQGVERVQTDYSSVPGKLDSIANRVTTLENGTVTFTRTNVQVPIWTGLSAQDVKSR